MLSLLLLTSAHAGTTPTCSITEANAGAHATWSVLAKVDGDGVDDNDAGYTNATARIATAFGDSEAVDLCPAGDSLGGAGLAVRRLGLIAIDIDPDDIGGSCPATSYARGEGVVEGTAQIEPRAFAASATVRARVDVQADNAAAISVDAGAGSRFSSVWQYRSSGSNTRLAGTIGVSLADATGGARLSLPGIARIDAWNGVVDAWVRRGAEYEHVVGPAPMRLDVSVVTQGRSGSVCGAGSASLGAVAEDGAGGIDAASQISFILTPIGTEEAFDRSPHDAPIFDLCTCL